MIRAGGPRHTPFRSSEAKGVRRVGPQTRWRANSAAQQPYAHLSPEAVTTA